MLVSMFCFEDRSFLPGLFWVSALIFAVSLRNRKLELNPFADEHMKKINKFVKLMLGLVVVCRFSAWHPCLWQGEWIYMIF